MTPPVLVQGALCALVTPFRDGAVDVEALRHLATWHLESGTHGLAPVGTTGEAATLSEAERRRVLETVIDTVAGRVPVIAGAGGPDTAACVEKLRHAKEVGADAALVVTPYYNTPNQDGLYAHYTALADAVALPIVAYTVPKRTGVNLSVETLARLSAHPNIVGVKDATADVARVARLRRQCAPGFLLFSGDDASALGFVALGGDGTISVTANVAPALMARMHDAALAGRIAEARAVNDQLAPLHDALFASPSPGPSKYALSLLDRCRPDVRAPITPPDAEAAVRVEAALELALAPEPAS